MSTRHPYECEKCGTQVRLTPAEYSAEYKHTKWGNAILCEQCEATPKPKRSKQPKTNRKMINIRPPHMPPNVHRLNLKPNERDDYGVTATIREQTTKHLLTLIETGPVTKALTNICNRVDALNGEWKIITTSTPATIFGDLQGNRNMEHKSVESTLLGKCHRLDLLETKPNPH